MLIEICSKIFQAAKIRKKTDIPVIFNKKRDVNPYNIPGNLIYNWLTFLIFNYLITIFCFFI